MEKPTLTVEIRLCESGNLRAWADVTYLLASGHELTVMGFRVIKSDGGQPWVAQPTYGYKVDDKFVNKRLLEMVRSLKKQVDDLILAEFDKKVAENA